MQESCTVHINLAPTEPLVSHFSAKTVFSSTDERIIPNWHENQKNTQSAGVHCQNIAEGTWGRPVDSPFHGLLVRPKWYVLSKYCSKSRRQNNFYSESLRSCKTDCRLRHTGGRRWIQVAAEWSKCERGQLYFSELAQILTDSRQLWASRKSGSKSRRCLKQDGISFKHQDLLWKWLHMQILQSLEIRPVQ